MVPRGAAKRGVRIRQSSPLTGVRVRSGRIEAVESGGVEIATTTVVCTAGAWSREVAALAGIDLPVEGEPVTSGSRRPTAGCRQSCR